MEHDSKLSRTPSSSFRKVALVVGLSALFVGAVVCVAHTGHGLEVAIVAGIELGKLWAGA